MQSSEASTKALFRYKMTSGVSTATSAKTSSNKLGSTPSGVPSDTSDDPTNVPPPVEEILNLRGREEPKSSNTINSVLNFKEIYKLRRSIIYCFCVALAGFVFGFDIGIIGGLVNFPNFQLRYGDNNGTFNRITLGLIVGACSISSCLSGLTADYLTQEYGRKAAIILAMVLYAIGGFVFVSSDAWYQLVAGRVFNGFGIGISSVAAPMLIGELPQPKLRGSLITSMQLMTTLGIFAGALTLYFCKNFRSDLQYFFPIYASLVIVFFTIMAVLCVPESPIFLVQKELHDNAADIIADINNLKKNHWYVSHLVQNLIKNTGRTNEQGTQRRKVSLRKGEPKIFHRAIIGIIIMVLQQLTGINYFFFYGTSIFQSAGIDDPYITSIVLASVNLVFSVISVAVSDSYGRRLMLILGSSSMFSCMMVFASVGSYSSRTEESGIIMITFTCLFIATFSLTWGPISFLLVSELFPYEFKSKGMSYASCANWATTFLVSASTPFFSEKIGFKFGYFFVFCLLISIAFVWGFVPETKKRESDSIDHIYSSGYKTFWRGTSQYDAKSVEMVTNSEKEELPQSPRQNDLKVTSDDPKDEVPGSTPNPFH